MDEVPVLEEAYDVQHDKVDMHTITIDQDPDEIQVDDAAVTCHMGYCVCQLMASTQDPYVSKWTLKLVAT